MDKAKIRQIADFLNDVYEGICEGDDVATMQMQLTELYRVIKLRRSRPRITTWECCRRVWNIGRGSISRPLRDGWA
jgi:hypothetical protein